VTEIANPRPSRAELGRLVVEFYYAQQGIVNDPDSEQAWARYTSATVEVWRTGRELEYGRIESP
jgi:hypothetical protein